MKTILARSFYPGNQHGIFFLFYTNSSFELSPLVATNQMVVHHRPPARSLRIFSLNFAHAAEAISRPPVAISESVLELVET